jgi:tetratricopeptide (TPR) repeat protein
MKRALFFVVLVGSVLALSWTQESIPGGTGDSTVPAPTAITPADSVPDTLPTASEPASTTVPAERRQTYQVISDHYRVESYLSLDDAALLSQELENRFAVYNQLFRFNPYGTKMALHVLAFDNKDEYDRYISAKLTGPHPDGAVYLHYNQVNLRELLVHRGSADEAVLLPNQAFIQYLRSFVSYPPTWLNKGFALYYYTLTFDPLTAGVKTGSDNAAPTPLVFEENLALLETVRGMVDTMPSLRALLLDAAPSPELSWALVSFFLWSGNSDYLRTLTESFMLLDRTANMPENAQKVLDRIAQYTAWDQLEHDFRAYIASRKTFNELIEDGLTAYREQNVTLAKSAFTAAHDLQPSHYAPYYYLGLLAYDAKDFDTAQQYYETSLEKSGGTDASMIFLALGFNMAAAGRSNDAIAWLQKAAVADPEHYASRVDDLIKRLE